VKALIEEKYEAMRFENWLREEKHTKLHPW
jgi:hypothetical protein